MTYSDILQLLQKIRPTYEFINCGSHYLGVADDDSDINLLCIGTEDRQHFIPQVKKILDQCGKFSKVIITQNQHTHCIKISGSVNVDLHYINKSNISLQQNGSCNENSMGNEFDNNSLSLVTEPQKILEYIGSEQAELFRWLRQSLKACNLYGQTYGYLGGLSIALLTAVVFKENKLTDLNDFKEKLTQINFSKVISLNSRKSESI
jgi:poly(A) polymerase Pap1